MSYKEKESATGGVNEILSQLEEQGWETMLCDVPVRVYDNPVSCGKPLDIGNPQYSIGWYPSEIVSCPERCFRTQATGSSMQDAAIDSGDWLTVETGVRVYDGDVVLARVDGEFLVKAYYEDNEGGKWLVPYNDKFSPVLINEEADVCLVGRVIEVCKGHPRVSNCDSRRIVNRFKTDTKPARALTREERQEVIRLVAPMVDKGRQWYAVCRAMVSSQMLSARDMEDFCQLVAASVPDHEHLPDAKELSRMAVQSFARPVSKWDEDNAPVTRSWFARYKTIALRTEDEMALIIAGGQKFPPNFPEISHQNG